MDYFQAGMAGKAGAQGFHQGGVDLDDDESLRVLEQLFGKRASARTDFNHDLRWSGTHRKRDTFENWSAAKEVLPEPLRHPAASSAAGGARAGRRPVSVPTWADRRW